MKNRKCFLSYAHTDGRIVQEQIIPILRELRIDYWYDQIDISIGDSVFNKVIQGIREADFVIVFFNSRSSYVNFEVGAAIGQNKPVLAILNHKYPIPSDIRNQNYLVYREEEDSQDFKRSLQNAIKAIEENVIDKVEYELSKGEKIIGIEVGTTGRNFEEELRITADLINFIKEISNSRDIHLVQSSKGCFKSLLSIDFKSWTELLEKLIFLIPEIKRRKTDRLKIESETKLIDANTRKSNVESDSIETDNRIKQANALLAIFERSEKLGLKLQIDDDVIFLNENTRLLIKKPDDSPEE